MAELKKKIFTDLGYEIETQKLILFGKMLADEMKLYEYNIKEGDFMVLMFTKVSSQI